MKARAVFALVVVLCLEGCPQALQEDKAKLRELSEKVDKAKLRELAELPTVGTSFGFRFSSSVGFYLGDKRDLAVELARLQKELKTDLRDDERYDLLGRIYSREGREKEADEAFAKAIAFCRQKIREHPEDIHWQVRLGDALLGTDDKEAEKLLRRAVQEAPNEWRGWLTLGDCMAALSFKAIFGDKNIAFDMKSTVAALRELKPTEEQIQEMRQLRNEALRCYDRAIKLAPERELKPYFHRIASNGNHAVVEASLRSIKGEKADPSAIYLVPECRADSRKIARLSPDDPQAIGVTMFWEIGARIHHNRLKNIGDRLPSVEDRSVANRSLGEVLPGESREFVLWCLDRLEQLAKHPDKAAIASEILGEAMAMLLETSRGLGVTPRDSSLREAAREKAIEYLRIAVRLDPSRERAWDLLTAALMMKQTDQAIAVARERLRVKDNAHNRFLLARAFADNFQFDEAAAELRAGLIDDPKDPYCRLGLIALTLRSEDAQSLKEAGKQLVAIWPRIDQEKTAEPYLSYCLLYGIYHALKDHPEKAREGFQEILQRKKGDQTATRALAALGEPLGPADRQIAIDYIQRLDGCVRRADKHKESPVERIDLHNGEITDDDLFVLTAFPGLHELNLSSSAITDAGLSNLMGLSRLRSLNLDDTKISDEGLLRLKALRELKHLSLKNTKVTRQGIDALRKELPQVEVHR